MELDQEVLSSIRNEYLAKKDLLNDFVNELVKQLTTLMEPYKATMAVPISSRVKTWDSIQEKIERKRGDVSSLQDITDLVGIRIVMLFQRELPPVDKVIKSKFVIHERDDKRLLLGATEFGYSSIHYLLSFQKKWLKAPTFAPYEGLSAELQLRTAAEHTWAAASHVLQYKQEESIPPTIRRAISRASALLETVDLEFERILAERVAYQKRAPTDSTAEILNVDLLAKVLSEQLPPANRVEQEPYAELLEDLRYFSITTPKQLRDLLLEQQDNMLNDEAISVEEMRNDKTLPPDLEADLAKGVYFSHVGLTRVALRHKFKDAWYEYVSRDSQEGVEDGAK